MKKLPKRFKSRESILDAMDLQNNEITEGTKKIVAYQAEISELRDWFAQHPNTKLTDEQSAIFHGKFGRLKLLNFELGIRQRAVPRHYAKLAILKTLLAEFDTTPMPFLEDHSVAVIR